MSALSCMRKAQFVSQIAAQSVIYRMRAKNQDCERLEVYQCDICKRWHLRHTPRAPLSPPAVTRVWNE